MEEESDTYFSDMPTRTQDNNLNVVRVGEEIAKRLREAGIGVVHDTTVHDYPSYSGSYDRSIETMRKNLEQYPTIQVTLGHPPRRAGRGYAAQAHHHGKRQEGGADYDHQRL